jgi:DNA polymerase-3 subunit beta
MQLNIDRKKFAQELGIAARMTGDAKTMPILGTVLLDAREGALRIAATNLETGFVSLIAAVTEEEGKVAVPGNVLHELVSSFNEERTILKLDAKTLSLHIRDGKSKSSIKCLPADDFPRIPEADIQGQIRVDASDLKLAFQRAGISISRDEARPVLTGANVHIQGEQLVIASADGFRLSVCNLASACDGQNGKTIILPGQALNEFTLALDESQSVEIYLPPQNNQAAFKFGTRLLISQLIEGKFPDIEPVIPKKSKTTVVVSRSSLLNACRQARIFSQDNKRDGGVVVMHFTQDSERGGVIQVSGQSEETGTTTNTVEASIEGPAVRIAFNSTFFIDGLATIKTPNARIKLNAADRPALIEPVGEQGYFYVLMPLQISQLEATKKVQPVEEPAAPAMQSPF